MKSWVDSLSSVTTALSLLQSEYKLTPQIELRGTQVEIFRAELEQARTSIEESMADLGDRLIQLQIFLNQIADMSPAEFEVYRKLVEDDIKSVDVWRSIRSPEISGEPIEAIG